MKKEYVLITPVRNEEKFISQVIESVIAQTILPKKWVIVDDGSTDSTEQIINRYQEQYGFIEQIKLSREDVESYYSRKTHVFLAGYDSVKDKVDYDFVGNLDADISIKPEYYESIMREFDKEPTLGVAGGVYIYQEGNKIERPPIDELCVPGSVQMFRRECYEQIGEYVSLKYGGDDTLAAIQARMNGWKTRHFRQYKVIQHRKVGTASSGSILWARFRQGLTEYGVATHPLFMLAKSVQRAFSEKPLFTGSLARLLGFLYGYCMREKRRVPLDVIRFVRREQIRRLLAYARIGPIG